MTGRQMSQQSAPTPIAVEIAPVVDKPVDLHHEAPELLEHFGNVQMNSIEESKLRDIYSWLGQDLEEVNSRTILNKIRKMEHMLRSSDNRSIDKLWDFIELKRRRR